MGMEQNESFKATITSLMSSVRVRILYGFSLVSVWRGEQILLIPYFMKAETNDSNR